MDTITRKCKSLIKFLLRTDAQDLIEYSMLAAIISLGAVASMRTLALDLQVLYLAIIVKFTLAVLS